MSKEVTKAKIDSSKDCFVIMPISDPDGYEQGHFKKVYEDIFRPACEKAGFRAVRADDITQTNLIHEDILRRLLESPIAICDLSSRNPNVLFELGLRQAFDKPTVLVQEVGTPRIFDIAPMRCTEYRKELRYREVLDDQKTVEVAISSTLDAYNKGEGINSIVRILSLSGPAALVNVEDKDAVALMQLVRAEMSELRSDFRRSFYSLDRNRRLGMRDASYNDGQKSTFEDLSSVRRMLEETEFAFGKMPRKLIIDRINASQAKLVSLMERDVPDRIQVEIQELLAKSEKMEGEALRRDARGSEG